jgi:hypothetical protein
MQAYGDADLARAAGRIWSLGRANPIDWEVPTAVGTFTTRDRATWQTASGAWTAELRRSRNGRHVYLALFENGVYRGRYDEQGWRSATDRRRIRHVRPPQLPLVA